MIGYKKYLLHATYSYLFLGSLLNVGASDMNLTEIDLPDVKTTYISNASHWIITICHGLMTFSPCPSEPSE